MAGKVGVVVGSLAGREVGGEFRRGIGLGCCGRVLGGAVPDVGFDQAGEVAELDVLDPFRIRVPDGGAGGVVVIWAVGAGRGRRSAGGLGEGRVVCGALGAGRGVPVSRGGISPGLLALSAEGDAVEADVRVLLGVGLFEAQVPVRPGVVDVSGVLMSGRRAGWGQVVAAEPGGTSCATDGRRRLVTSEFIDAEGRSAGCVGQAGGGCLCVPGRLLRAGVVMPWLEVAA